MTIDRGLLPREARRVVARACRAASTGPECEESAVLLTSEVVSNALVHGRGPVDVGVDAGRSVVRVEVGDEDPRHPEPGPGPTPDLESGRGLLIVEALSSAWGATDRPDGGKSVWFEVPTQP